MSRPGPDGVRRWAVVLADASAAAAAPPGVDGRSYALAMAEDVIELVGELSIVSTAVVTVSGGDRAWMHDVATRCWPGTPVLAGPDGGAGAAVLAALALAQEAGGDAAVVVAGDAPDLPGLLLGKLFRSLGAAEVAVSTTDAGELVALASRLSPPIWLDDEVAALDAGAAAVSPSQRLGLAGGSRLALGPGWHRLRAPADVGRLDPGLEGWASTRELLSVPTR